MILLPVQFRRRKGKPRVPFVPPAPGLSILSVQISAVVNTQLIVTFSDAITWDGSTVPTAFRAFTQDGFLDPCINVIGVGSDWIELEFNAGVDPDAAWELLAAMEGITAVSGGAVSFPQAGSVAG